MGFWDVSPFGNDDAADFADERDEAATQARIEMVGGLLERVAGTTDDLGFADAPRAVAAAALIAAQCPGGEPVHSTYGPATPMPQFPKHLMQLAINALDRVVTPPSWLAECWTAESDHVAWRQTINDLRGVLDPPQAETLFDL